MNMAVEPERRLGLVLNSQIGGRRRRVPLVVVRPGQNELPARVVCLAVMPWKTSRVLLNCWNASTLTVLSEHL
jgi:hypothetical protein